MRRFHVKFTEKNLTGNAGLVLLGRFADKLKLAQMLEQHITIKRGATAQYRVSDIIMILMMAVLAGAKHMSHVFILRSDSALRSLLNGKGFLTILPLIGSLNCSILDIAMNSPM